MWACLTSRIVSLSLADCINVADEAVGAVAQLLPSLYEFSLQVSLRITACSDASVLAFQCLFEYFPSFFGTENKFGKLMNHAKFMMFFFSKSFFCMLRGQFCGDSFGNSVKVFMILPRLLVKSFS